MIEIDANALVRYLTQDDPRQAAIATRLIEHDLTPAKPGFISLVVLVELCRVLKRLYAATEVELVATVQDLLGLAQLRLENRDVVQVAIHQMNKTTSTEAGLTDRLITHMPPLRAAPTR